jgi:putative FmdB family regulatory protein
MATYEYLCKSCKNRFEKWQRMTDEPLSICPECGGPIHRVFYPAGVVFKGSGFYKTDHAGSSAVDSNGHTQKGEKEPAAEGGKKASDESKSGSTESGSNTTSTTKKEVATPTK